MSFDEFYEKVGTESGKRGFNLKAQLAEQAIPLAPESDGEGAPGALVQYAHMGEGFQPTSTTVKRLPADVYRIIVAPNQTLYLDPNKLSTDALINFPDSQSDLVINEIETFWSLKDKFKEFGILHKRGFLLWGPPGSGKTCTIALIIDQMLKKDGIVILADNPAFLGHMLLQIRKVEPNRPMVVIWEDLDSVIDRFGETTVLSVLDGESQVDEIVFIATTNYPERLDARITNRPSRFDMIVKIDMPNDEARTIFLTKKLGTTISPEGMDLVKETKGLTFAHMRELIVGVYCLKNKTVNVIERLKKMKASPNSSNLDQKIGLLS